VRSFSRTAVQRWVVLAAIPLLSFVFAPGLHSAFLVPKTFALLAITAVLLLLAQWPNFVSARSFWITVTVWLLSILVSGLRSAYPELRLEAIAFAVSGPLLLLGTQHVLREHAETWQKALVATGAVIALIVLAQVAFKLDLFQVFGSESAVSGRMRAFGTLGNPLFAGVFLAPMLVIANAQVQQTRARWPIIAAFVIALGIAFTGSRTALVAAAVGLLLTTKAAMRNAAAVIMLIGIAFYFGTRLTPRPVSEAAQGRVFISRVALANGATFLGSGPGSFAVTYPTKLSSYFTGGKHQDEYRFAGYERHAHNEWTETLVENGGIGLAAFAAVFVAWFWVVRREPLTPTRRTATAIVATLLVASLADFTFHRAETWALLWMAMGAALPSTPEPERPPIYMWVPKIALAALLLWAALPPLFASRAILLGADAERANDPARAVAHYQAALSWQPASPDGNFNLTRALCKQGELDACWTQSERARRWVDEAELYILRTNCLEAQGRFLEAGVELAQARERFLFSKALRE
jgi:O-antigen ligase